MNAVNVLGSENTVPAAKWLHLIRHTLNNTSVECPTLRRSCSTPSSMWQNIGDLSTPSRASSMKDTNTDAHNTPGSLSSNETGATDEAPCTPNILQLNACLGTPFEDTMQDPFLNEAQIYSMRASSYTGAGESVVPCLSPSLSTRSMKCKSNENKSRFTLIASKQMVGVFVSVWIRGDLRRHVHNLKVSCVGCGLLGYLGNKVSQLQETLYI